MKLKTSFFSRLMRPLLATATFAGLALAANAAGYLKIGDIQGESTDKEHKEWINLLSVSQSITRPMDSGATGSTRQRGSAVLDDIVCVKELDKASPKLMEGICRGTVYPKVEIHLTKSITDASGGVTQQTYLKYELTNVIITSYSVNASGNDEAAALPNIGSSGEDGVDKPTPPQTRCSLNFEEIKVTYTEFEEETGRAKGNVEYSWKIEKGE